MGSTLKKIAFLAMAAFLVERSLGIMGFLLDAGPGQLGQVETFLLALFLNLCITGIFAFPGFVFPTSSLLGDWYYTIRWPSALQRLYDGLGVSYFRSLLMVLFWGIGRNREKYFDGTRSGLDNLVYQARQSEFGHLMSFLLVLTACAVLARHGHGAVAAWGTLVNVIGNLYPVILQRHHRLRVERLQAAYLKL
jgi:hypothetical protein